MVRLDFFACQESACVDLALAGFRVCRAGGATGDDTVVITVATPVTVSRAIVTPTPSRTASCF